MFSRSSTCRRKGLNLMPHNADDSGNESPASPLSEATSNYKKNVPKYQLPSINDLFTHRQNVISTYKLKLKSLNSLLSPMQLFYEFDLMMKNYETLKKEYCLQWELQQLYRQQIRSIIKHKDHDLIMPLNDIDLLIQRLENIQFSILQLFTHVVQQSPKMRTRAVTKNEGCTQSNIKPSNAKRLSASGAALLSDAQRNNVIATITKTKTKTKQKTKAKTRTKTKSRNRRRTRARSRRKSSVRSFGSLYSEEFRYSVATHYKKQFKSTWNELQIVKYYHDNYIGQNEYFESPFGVRRIIYCDWTASGKSLNCIEDYIRDEILPYYANTHTTTSITGIQTSRFRSEARSIILESLGADHNEDVVLFCGSGSTAAIYKLSHVLLKSFGDKPYAPSSTVVFISVYEHNSNIFIWKELGCKLIVIPENSQPKKGHIDLAILEKHLRFYTSPHMKHKYNLLIGSFTAASNVSGIIAPIDDITLLLHRYNALSFWDFATAGPYCDVNMSNTEDPMLSKDAVFISVHKYLGGPGSPGILCAKKVLFTNYIPVCPGGGTVFVAYGVHDGEWEYLDNIEEREEGGTTDIIGSIRAALTFMIRDHLSTQFIERVENEYLHYFWRECKAITNLIMMGNTECDRLPVLSFLITHTKKGFGAAKKTKYLHYNFIAALMNDLFGIQGRGGCACAGMYGKHVLNLSDKEIDYVVLQLREHKNELSRPGYFRVNLHYTLNQEELQYIVDAIKFVCTNGWLFVALYDVDSETGNYFIKNKSNLRSLLDISFTNNQIMWKKRSGHKKHKHSLKMYFDSANDILRNLHEYLPSKNEFKNEKRICDESAWYWLPSELYLDALHYRE